MQFKAGKGESDPNIIRLKSGEKVIGIFRGEPYEFSHAFNPGDKPGFRFRLNMIVKENNVLVCKIYEGGYKLYTQLKDLNDAGWDLEKCYTQISRQGETKNNTVYSATVVPTKPPEATLQQVGLIPLHDLKKNSEQPATTEVNPSFDAPSENGDVPF